MCVSCRLSIFFEIGKQKFSLLHTGTCIDEHQEGQVFYPQKDTGKVTNMSGLWSTDDEKASENQEIDNKDHGI